MSKKQKMVFLLTEVGELAKSKVGLGFFASTKLLDTQVLSHDRGFICSSLFFNTIINELNSKIKSTLHALHIEDINYVEASEYIQNIFDEYQLSISLNNQLNSVIQKIEEDGGQNNYLLSRRIISDRPDSQLSTNNKEKFISKSKNLFDEIILLYRDLYSAKALKERDAIGIDHLNYSVTISVHVIEKRKDIYRVITHTQDKQLGELALRGDVYCGITQKSIPDVYTYSLHNSKKQGPILIDSVIDNTISSQDIDFSSNKQSVFGVIEKKQIKQQILNNIMDITYQLKQFFGNATISFLINGSHVQIISMQQLHVISTPETTHLHQLVINKNAAPFIDVQAKSSGVCISQYPHDDIFVKKSIGIADLSSLMQATGVIALSDEIDQQVLAFLREKRIPCLIFKDAKELLKQKKITLFGKGKKGKIFQGFVSFEHQSVTDNFNIDTALYSFIHDISEARSLGALPTQALYYQLSDMFVSEGVHPSAFFAKETPAKIKSQLLQKIFGARVRSQALKGLIIRYVTRILVAVPHKKVIVEIPWYDNDQFEKLKQYGTTYERKYIQVVISAFQEIIDLGFSNLVIVSDHQQTPDHLEEYKKILTNKKNKLSIGILLDVYKNKMLAKDFSKITDLAVVTIDDCLKAKENISSLSKFWKRKKKFIVKLPLGNYNQKQLDILIQRGISGMVLEPDMLLKYVSYMKFLEKTIGKKGKQTHIPLLTFVISLGVFAIVLIAFISGYRNLRTPVTVPDTVQTELSPADLRKKIVEKEQKKKETEFLAQRSTLSVNDFAQFQIDYPSWWKVSYWNGGVTVEDQKTGEFISIFKQLVGHPINELDRKKITISGKKADKFSDQLPQDGSTVQVVEISIEDEILEINSTYKNFEELLATFSFIETKGLSGKATHWDIREKRVCAQMITYARKNKDAICSAYASPCDVPDNYDVCDSNDI